MSTQEEVRHQARLLAVQSAVLREAKKIVDQGRAELAAAMEPGERLGDAESGMCTLTRPSDKAVVADREQLEAHLIAEGTPTVATINNIGAAIDVLALHAPHLLTEAVPGWAVAAAETRALAGEAIPGIGVAQGMPVLQVRPSEAVKVSVREALAAGRIGLEA